MLACLLPRPLTSLPAPQLVQAAVEEVEDAEVRAPPPPTDTPAGDLALAAKQFDAEAVIGGAARQAPSTAAAAAAADPGQQSGAAEQQQQQEGQQPEGKRRPRIVAT